MKILAHVSGKFCEATIPTHDTVDILHDTVDILHKVFKVAEVCILRKVGVIRRSPLPISNMPVLDKQQRRHKYVKPLLLHLQIENNAL